MIFTGGTGNPFFTTDTNAIVRALQMRRDMVWKATRSMAFMMPIRNKDPATTIEKNYVFKQALEKNLQIMDSTAFALADENRLTDSSF